MRLPRVRFTMRRMMVAVAVAGLEASLIIAVARCIESDFEDVRLAVSVVVLLFLHLAVIAPVLVGMALIAITRRNGTRGVDTRRQPMFDRWLDR